MPGKVKTVRLVLSEIVADRLQYKPYTAHLNSPEEKPIFVDIEVPESEVVLDEKDRVVITSDGLAAIMGKVATSIENMHNDYITKTYKKG